jgi:RNase P/RNase MRP subunit p30
MREYVDVNAGVFDKEKVGMLEDLGWNAACFTGKVKKPDTRLRIYKAAVVTSEARKNTRKALDNADVVIAAGDSGDFYREACECVEVDLIQDPELIAKNDAIDYPASGLDPIIAKSMRENNIAYLLDFKSILDSSGLQRARIIRRMRYNTKLCVKYGVSVVTASCCTHKYGLRCPRELASIGQLLGLDRSSSMKTVSENPLKVLEKTLDRSNPDVITKGVRVVEWGTQEKKPKKKHGWY